MSLKKITFALVIAGSLASCVKPPETESTPTTPEEVGSAIAEGWGEFDPWTMQAHDFISQDTTSKIDTNPTPYFTLREGITISEKNDLGDALGYKYLYQFQVIRNNTETPLSTKEAERSSPKPPEPTPTPAPASMATVTQPSSFQNTTVADQIRNMKAQDIKPMADDYKMYLAYERVASLAGVCFRDDQTVKYCKEQMGLDDCEIECSNLKVQEIMRPVPDEVKAQENCGGYENCMWKTKMITFDWKISLKKDGAVETQKVNYLVTLVPELPFFARLLDLCSRQLVTLMTPDPNDPMNGRKLLVNTCTTMKNFRAAPKLPTP